MTASPSSSARGARHALAARLQHLRRDAGLTGRELSARCGWHPAKTTRIQKGEAAPSDADIRSWCTACDADDQADDLIAAARAVDSMYLEWRRPHRTGMRTVQEGWYALHEQTRLSRVYVSNVPPGFFQTPAFATALMEQITAFMPVMDAMWAQRRVYGSDFDDPDPGLRPGQEYVELVGGALDGLLLDVTGWTPEQLAGGAALITEAGAFGPGCRACHSPDPVRPQEWSWDGDTA